VEAKNQQLKTNKMDKISSIRNRQVASSTLALGSNISFVSSAVRTLLNPLFTGRCTHVAQIEFFAKSVHRIYLRFAHRFYLDIHGQTYVAVSQNRLNRFIVHA